SGGAGHAPGGGPPRPAARGGRPGRGGGVVGPVGRSASRTAAPRRNTGRATAAPRRGRCRADDGPGRRGGDDATPARAAWRSRLRTAIREGGAEPDPPRLGPGPPPPQGLGT